MFTLGLTINHFSTLDPEELRHLGWCKRLLGVYCKVVPTVIKVINLLKFGLFVIITLMIVLTDIGHEYTPDPKFTTYDDNCKDANAFDGKLRPSYINQLIIFHSMEGISVIVTMFVLCMIKTVLDINAVMYQPYDKNAGKLRKIFLRHLGP
jgi:hypothetical protein